MVSREVLAPALAVTGRPKARPVLVTGVPRSGTTWLARELASARRAGLAGREPMNPRQGQFALAGTLQGWVRLEEPTGQQQRLLRRTYRGLEPRVYSRYGSRQWLAPMPGVHTIVKDPFALLSVPAIVRVTGAVPVVVYRPCGAVLASYRRMGWTADVTELRRAVSLPEGSEPDDDVTAMVEFWNLLHRAVLDWLPEVPGAVLVSHAELTDCGHSALEQVMRACGLQPTAKRRATAGAAAPQPGRLHAFDRAPAEVTQGWRTRLTTAELERLDAGTREVLGALDEQRLRVS